MFSKLVGKGDKGEAKADTEADAETQAEVTVATDDSEGTDKDEVLRKALASKFRAAAVGEIISIMMRSPKHKNYRLADLEWLLVPAILTKQYVIAKGTPNTDKNAVGIPVGVAFWARVSDEIDQTLSQELEKPVHLKAQDWTSGENYWLLDIVAAPKVSMAMLDELKRTVFANRSFKVRRMKDDKIVVETLQGTDQPASAA